MAKREKSIEEQIKEETAMLIDSFLRWEHIRTYGCQDPFYPDGELGIIPALPLKHRMI